MSDIISKIDTIKYSIYKKQQEMTQIKELEKLLNSPFINKNDIQIQVGLDGKTFDSYFSVLEHTYQIQKLQPYFNNQLKRLVKTPKIFSIDTGVLCHLLQINSEDEFNKSPLKGEILETFIFSELLKANYLWIRIAFNTFLLSLFVMLVIYLEKRHKNGITDFRHSNICAYVCTYNYG